MARKFKKGDRVEVVKATWIRIKVGMRGTVYALDLPSVGICFGKGFDGHTFGGKIRNKTGWWLQEDELKILRRAPAKKARGKRAKR